MIRTPPGSLVTFFVLTYGVTWTAFVSVAVLGIPADSTAGIVLVLLGAYSPSIVALSLTRRAEGGEGVGALFARVIQWRVAARWYVFAAGYMAAIKLAA